MDMHFQLYELHVQQAIRETILHVRASKCMSMGELHVQHAFWLSAGEGHAFWKTIYMSAGYNVFGHAYPKVICVSNMSLLFSRHAYRGIIYACSQCR